MANRKSIFDPCKTKNGNYKSLLGFNDKFLSAIDNEKGKTHQAYVRALSSNSDTIPQVRKNKKSQNFNNNNLSLNLHSKKHLDEFFHGYAYQSSMNSLYALDNANKNEWLANRVRVTPKSEGIKYQLEGDDESFQVGASSLLDGGNAIKISKICDLAGKTAMCFEIAGDIYDIGTAKDQKKAITVDGCSFYGGIAGAALLSFIPFVGPIAGGIIGSEVGKYFGEQLYDLGKSKTKIGYKYKVRYDKFLNRYMLVPDNSKITIKEPIKKLLPIPTFKQYCEEERKDINNPRRWDAYKKNNLEKLRQNQEYEKQQQEKDAFYATHHSSFWEYVKEKQEQRIKNAWFDKLVQEGKKSYAWHKKYGDVPSPEEASDLMRNDLSHNQIKSASRVPLYVAQQWNKYIRKTFGGNYAKHASGGLFNHPHLGLVAEDGPEAIIPLSTKRRSSGLSLWKEAGRLMGVEQYANGGIVGNVTPLHSKPSVNSKSDDNSTVQVSLAGNSFHFHISGGDNAKNIVDEIENHADEIVNIISLKLAPKLEKAFVNRTA